MISHMKLTEFDHVSIISLPSERERKSDSAHQRTDLLSSWVIHENGRYSLLGCARQERVPPTHPPLTLEKRTTPNNNTCCGNTVVDIHAGLFPQCGEYKGAEAII